MNIAAILTSPYARKLLASERNKRKNSSIYSDYHLQDSQKNYWGGIYDDECVEGWKDLHRVGLQKYEYYCGNKLSVNTEKMLSVETPSIIPYMAPYGYTQINVRSKEHSYQKLIDDDRWHYLTLSPEEKIKIISDGELIIGDPILMDDGQKTHNIKLLIICDSLSAELLTKAKRKELMPHTHEFFSNAVYFSNCYCCSDWTLPGIGTIYSGAYPIEHRMLHPRKRQIIGKTLVSEYKEKGYLTSHFGSNWRCPPEYGYIRDVDRFVYVYGMKKGTACELIGNLIEHLNAFPNRDHFIILNLYDLHHLQRGISDISVQTRQNLEMQFYENTHKGKSVTKGFDETQKRLYELEVSRLDSYLAILYRYLERRNDTDIILAADHGVTFIKDTVFHTCLEDKMTHVPLYVKSSSLQNEIISAPTENTIIYDILKGLANRAIRDNSSLKEIAERPYAYNECIYPGQKYSARIIDERYTATYCSNSLTGEDCMVPKPEGNEEIHVYEPDGNEITDCSCIQGYRELFANHILLKGK